MKKLLLVLGASLFSFAGHAQFTRTYAGALTLTDPTVPGDRLFRDGTIAACGVTKVYPGLSGSAITGVHYDTYIIGNTSTTASTCLTITLAPTCTDATGNPLFVTVYTSSFVATNLATNYKSDIGASPAVSANGIMGVTLAPSERVVVVVSGVTAAAVCNSYGLTVAAPIALPVEASRNAEVALAAYPNPVTDVLHITAAKAGSYTLYNTTGAMVRKINGTEVLMSDLPGGVYMLQQNETKATTRIIKI